MSERPSPVRAEYDVTGVPFIRAVRIQTTEGAVVVTRAEGNGLAVTFEGTEKK